MQTFTHRPAAPYRETKSRGLRTLLVIAGTVSLVLGIIGVVLPLLPTTPFILLSAACYARSSRRFYMALLSNRYTGQLIDDWRSGLGISRRAKCLAVGSLVVVLGSSIIFFVPLLWVKVVLAFIGLSVAAHILRMPTRCHARVAAPTAEDGADDSTTAGLDPIMPLGVRSS